MSVSSGLAGLATSGDDDVTAIVKPDDQTLSHIAINNGGIDGGFYSVDGGATFAFFPGNFYLTQNNISITGDVVIKRVVGQRDLTNVFINVW